MTAYEMRISDWSSDVCSSDLRSDRDDVAARARRPAHALGDRRLLAADDDHVVDGHARGAVGAGGLGCDGRGTRDVGARGAGPAGCRADAAAHGFRGRVGRLLLLPGVESAGDGVGEDGGEFLKIGRAAWRERGCAYG